MLLNKCQNYIKIIKWQNLFCNICLKYDTSATFMLNYWKVVI